MPDQATLTFELPRRTWKLLSGILAMEPMQRQAWAEGIRYDGFDRGNVWSRTSAAVHVTIAPIFGIPGDAAHRVTLDLDQVHVVGTVLRLVTLGTLLDLRMRIGAAAPQAALDIALADMALIEQARHVFRWRQTTEDGEGDYPGAIAS